MALGILIDSPGNERMDEMVAEIALEKPRGPATEAAESLIGLELFLPPSLRWLGPEEGDNRGSITEAPKRQVEDNALSHVLRRYEDACESNPAYALLGVSGWEMAEHEFRLQEQWEEVIDAAWHKYIVSCATRNTEPEVKEVWIAEMQFAFRPGLVGWFTLSEGKPARSTPPRAFLFKKDKCYNIVNGHSFSNLWMGRI